MKKIRIILLQLLACLLMITGCSNKNVYDQDTLTTAANITRQWGIETANNPFKTGERFFNVTKESEDSYSVETNETTISITISTDKQPIKNVPLNITDVQEKYQKTIDSSKKLIYQYIDASEILKDKDKIKEFIDKLPIKKAVYTVDKTVAAYFSHDDEVVYINANALPSFVCEEMIVHELMHAVSYYTHGCNINNSEYAFSRLNEVITDILTISLKPKISEGVYSGYALFYELIFPYINLFGEKAIEAYFYGYDEIYKQVSKDEFGLFVTVIDNYEKEEVKAYYTNLMFKWYANK